MALLSLLKTKIWAIGAGIFATMLAIIKFQALRNKGLKKDRDQLKANEKFRTDVVEIDEDIEEDFAIRRVQARKEIESGSVPENLRDPNDF